MDADSPRVAQSVEKHITIGVAGHVDHGKTSLVKALTVSVEGPVVFAGGVARNPCMHRLLEEALQSDILVPERPQMVGALGAALLAGDGK